MQFYCKTKIMVHQPVFCVFLFLALSFMKHIYFNFIFILYHHQNNMVADCQTTVKYALHYCWLSHRLSIAPVTAEELLSELS